MDLKNMHYCAAMQPSTRDFPITIYKLVKTNLTLQSSFTEKKKSQCVYMVSFFLKMKISGVFLCWRLFQSSGMAVRQRGFYIHQNSGCKMFCSPVEGLPQSAWNVSFFCDKHAQCTHTLCATGISELIDGMESFVTLRWKCRERQDGRETSLHSSDTCDSKSCLLYTSAQFCSLQLSHGRAEHLALQGETLDHACCTSLRHQHRGSSKMGEELFTGASVELVYCSL